MSSVRCQTASNTQRLLTCIHNVEFETIKDISENDMFALLSSSLKTCVAVLSSICTLSFNKKCKRKINLDLLFKRLYQIYSNNMTNFSIISFLIFKFISRWTGYWRHVRATVTIYLYGTDGELGFCICRFLAIRTTPSMWSLNFVESFHIGAKFRISNDLKRRKGYGGLMVTTQYILRFHLYSFYLKFIRPYPSAITKRM